VTSVSDVMEQLECIVQLENIVFNLCCKKIDRKAHPNASVLCISHLT